MLRRSQKHWRLGISEAVVVTGHEMVGEPVPRIYRYLYERLMTFFEQETSRKAILEGHLLCPVRNEEEDAVGRTTLSPRELNEPLDQNGRLAGARPPQSQQGPIAVLYGPTLICVELETLRRPSRHRRTTTCRHVPPIPLVNLESQHTEGV
jgi:hypothetical protein